MKIETNINTIHQIAHRKKNENLSFRSFLKGQEFDKVDKIVHKLYKEVSSQIDCLKCGNCCLNLRPLVTDEELRRLANIDKVTLSEFEEKHITHDNFENFKYLKSIPCKYLKDKKCMVYSDRPEECRSYPYLHKDMFISRTLGVLNNYEICPIVFNVFELLKLKLGWKRR